MAGDFPKKVSEFASFLKENKIDPFGDRIAYDLGAGHGIQSVALAKSGYNVTAIDFSQQLLDELAANAGGLSIQLVNGDIRQFKHYTARPANVIACCGDTLTHLESKEQVKNLVDDIASGLVVDGLMILSFRDYTRDATGTSRSIPVKTDNDRTLTCILEYKQNHVVVTDVLKWKGPDGWTETAMSYSKIILDPKEVEGMVKNAGLRVSYHQMTGGMVTIVAMKTTS